MVYAKDLFRLIKCGNTIINRKLTTAQVRLAFIANNTAFYDVKQLFRCIRIHFNNAQSMKVIVDFESMPSPTFMLDGMVELMTRYGCIAETREKRSKRRVLNLKSLQCNLLDSRYYFRSENLDKPASLMAFLLLKCARNYDLPVLTDVWIEPSLRGVGGPLFDNRERHLVMFRKLSPCLTSVIVPLFLMDRSRYRLMPSVCGPFVNDLCINYIDADRYFLSSTRFILEKDMICPSNQVALNNVQFSNNQLFIDNLSRTLVSLDLDVMLTQRSKLLNCRYSELSPDLKTLVLGPSIKLHLDTPLHQPLEHFDVIHMRDEEGHFQLSNLPKTLRRIAGDLIYRCDFKSDDNWWHYWPEHLQLGVVGLQKIGKLLSHFLPHVEESGACAFTINYMILCRWRKVSEHNMLSEEGVAAVGPLLIEAIINWDESALPFPLDVDWVFGLTKPYLLEGKHDGDANRYVSPNPNPNVLEMELDFSESPWVIDSQVMIDLMIKRLVAIFPNVRRVAIGCTKDVQYDGTHNFARFVDSQVEERANMTYSEMSMLSGSINPALVEQTTLRSDDEVSSSDNDDIDNGRYFHDRYTGRKYPRVKPVKALFNTLYNRINREDESEDSSSGDDIYMSSDDDVNDVESNPKVEQRSDSSNVIDLDELARTVATSSRTDERYDEGGGADDNASPIINDEPVMRRRRRAIRHNPNYDHDSDGEAFVDDEDGADEFGGSDDGSKEYTSSDDGSNEFMDSNDDMPISSGDDVSVGSTLGSNEDDTKHMMHAFFIAPLVRLISSTPNKVEKSKSSMSRMQSLKSRLSARPTSGKPPSIDYSRSNRTQQVKRHLPKLMLSFVNGYLAKLTSLDSLFCVLNPSIRGIRHPQLDQIGPTLKRLDLCNVLLSPKLLHQIRNLNLTTLNLALSNKTPNSEYLNLFKHLPPTLLHFTVFSAQPTEFNGCFLQLVNWLPPNLKFLSLDAFTMTRSQFLPLVHLFSSLPSRRFLSMMLLTRLMNGQVLKEAIIPFYYATLMPL